MLQLIKKSEYWAAAICAGEPSQLQFSDVLAYVVTASVSELEMARIGYIATNQKLSLNALQDRNEVFEISKAHIKIVEGDASASKSSVPPAKSLDAMFSVGWLSSIPEKDIQDLINAACALVKSGGLMLHTFEFVVQEHPSPYWSNRFNALKEIFNGGSLIPLGDIMADLVFTCDAASISDSELFNRRKLAPELDSLRMRSQTVGLVLAGRCL